MEIRAGFVLGGMRYVSYSIFRTRASRLQDLTGALCGSTAVLPECLEVGREVSTDGPKSAGVFLRGKVLREFQRNQSDG